MRANSFEMRMVGWKRLPVLTALLTLSMALAGCGDDEDDNPLTPGPDKANLRVVHASPDAAAVDVYVEGSNQPLVTDLAYGEVSANVEIEAGTYRVQLRAAGADPTDDPLFETGDVALEEGSTITAVAAGLLDSQDAADRFRLLPLEEGFDGPDAGFAQIRVVHASPDAPTVDFDLGDDGSAEFVGLARFQDSAAAGYATPAGTKIFVAILSGGSKLSSFTLPALTAGADYFLIATGLVGQGDPAASDAFRLLAVDRGGTATFVAQDPPSEGIARIRVVHAVPAAPAVDVYLEGMLLPWVSELYSGFQTSYIEVPAGPRKLQLRAFPSVVTDPVLGETGSFPVAVDQDITAVAVGFLDVVDPEQELRLVPLVEDFGAPSGALVRVLHGSADAPTVDLDVGDDGSWEIVGLERFASTDPGGISLPSGTALQVAVRPAGGGRLTAFTTPALPDGEEIFLVATGSLELPAGDPGAFSLLAVTPSDVSPYVRQNPLIYFVHGGPDAPAVDIFEGGEPATALVEDLDFGGLSGPLQLPPALHEWNVRGGSSGTSLGNFGFDMLAGDTYFAVLAGELAPEGSEAAFTMLPYRQAGEAEVAGSLLRAVHAVGDAGLVDVGTVDSGSGDLQTIVFSNLVFGQATDPAQGTDVPTGDLVLGVAPRGEIAPLATFAVSTAMGRQYLSVLAGAAVPDGGEEGLRLLFVDATERPWSIIAVPPQ